MFLVIVVVLLLLSGIKYISNIWIFWQKILKGGMNENYFWQSR